jgi:peptidoglycan/LPS O-acetylase OafA/YrhL
MRLTALRGLASLVVVFYHALLLYKVGAHDDSWKLPFQIEDGLLLAQQLLLMLFNGQAAVVLFFVLSGCVLALSLQRGPALDGPVVTAFYIRRGFRILPTLWFSVAVAYLLFPLANGVHGAVATAATNRTYLAIPSPPELVGHLIGFYITLNPPLWSLFVELFYSALLPLLFWATLTRQRLAVLLTLALALLFLPIQHVRTVNLYAYAFAMGCVIANVLPRTAPGWRWSAPALVLAFAALAVTRRIIDPLGVPMSISVFIETTAAAAIVYLVLSQVRGTAWLAWRPLVFLGEISYSLYLLHLPILFSIAYGVKWLLGEPFIAANGVVAALTVAMPTAVVTVLAATATYRLVELPTQQLGRAVAGTLALTRARTSAPAKTGLGT